MNHIEILSKYDACAEAIAWAQTQPDASTAWAACERGDWLLWLAAKVHLDRKLLVRAACACARQALQYIPDGEERPRLAIETAEAWARGEATIEELRKAADAAASATHAADATHDAAAYAAYAADAAWAADAAAYAAYAADAAAANAAAANAAYAANAAAWAADAAAWAAAAYAAYAADAAAANAAAAAARAAVAANAAANAATYDESIKASAYIVRGIIALTDIEEKLT
jgi:hypothetical protein